MKLRINFSLTLIIVLVSSAYQLFAGGNIEEAKAGFNTSKFGSAQHISETVTHHRLGGFEFSSDKTENKSRVVTTTNDEKFDDDETNSKKRPKVLKDYYLIHYFQNKNIYPLAFRNELDYHEHFTSRSYSLYILLQVFRI